LCERATVLRYTYIGYLVFFWYDQAIFLRTAAFNASLCMH
jgi:hypothetical protein